MGSTQECKICRLKYTNFLVLSIYWCNNIHSMNNIKYLVLLFITWTSFRCGFWYHAKLENVSDVLKELAASNPVLWERKISKFEYKLPQSPKIRAFCFVIYCNSVGEQVGSNREVSDLSLVSVVCCQVEVSAMCQSLVQRSHTEGGITERDTLILRKPRPTRAFKPWKKNSKLVIQGFLVFFTFYLNIFNIFYYFLFQRKIVYSLSLDQQPDHLTVH